MPPQKTSSRVYRIFLIAFFFITYPAPNIHADFTSCATDWNNFANNPGYIADYTYKGTPIKDYESVGTGDPSHGPANVPPASTDLASNASAGTNPGAQTTPFFGYYDGNTPYDPNNPSTLEDDFIFFRMRVGGDPRAGGKNPPDFDSYHWNVLFDVDGDGYKEYWVDLEGSCTNQVCGGNYDRLNILYNNENRQDIADPDAAGVRVEYFQARNAADPNATCTYGYSHTRTYAVPDGSGDWYIDIQVPMTAFNDAFGNQVLFPNSPVAFVFSTGASNQNPLQKDHMMDLKMLSLNDPITFGDVIMPNGEPQIYFTNNIFDHVDFYAGPAGDSIYVYVTDRFANTDATVQSITVTVTNPATGDDQQITLTETGPNTGIFTSGALSTAASDGIQNNSDNNGTLEVSAGDAIQVSYTNSRSQTVTDYADIIGACQAYVQFTRANGLPTAAYQLTTSRTTSDKVYVTVTHREANTSATTVQTITVNLTGTSGDLRTLTLTETDLNTGIFRNTTGQDTEVATAPIDTTDDLWEDNDGGTVTVNYSYGALGSCPAGSAPPETASIFYTSSAGRIYFTNSTGVFDVNMYTNNQPVYLKVVDANACALSGCNCTTIGGVRTFTVTVTSDVTGESETVRLYETVSSPYSNVFMNISSPLTAITYSAPYVVDDTYIEANNLATIRASYNDCSDGDNDSSNDNKTDTATYNVPDIIINAVLFYPDPSTCQTEYVELLNNSAVSVNATGFRITDEDGSFNYTIPQVNGSDIILQPSETIIVSLYNTGTSPQNQKTGSVWYLFDTTSPTFPSDYFGDPGGGDPADQVILYNGSGTAIDYLGWSPTPNNTLDFLSDDAQAVLGNIWQDDSFKNISGIPIGYALQRSPSGTDTNVPADWTPASGQSTVCQAVITRASVSSLSASEDRGSVAIQWETVSEIGTVGFHLLRRDLRSGVTEQVNGKLLPASIRSPFGSSYRLVDVGASSQGSYEYDLFEVDAHGKKHHVRAASFNRQSFRDLGSIQPAGLVPPIQKSDDFAYMFTRDDGTIVLTNNPAGVMGGSRQTAAPRAGLHRYVDNDGTLVTSGTAAGSTAMRSAAAAYTVSDREPAQTMSDRISQFTLYRSRPPFLSPPTVTVHAKIAVDSDGIYFLTASEIGTLFRMTPSAVKQMIAGNSLSLSNRGGEIPYFPEDDLSGISFYGEGIESMYTTDNIYWLTLKPGKQMAVIRGNAPLPSSAVSSSIETITFEENSLLAQAYSHDPNGDFWLWDFIFSDYPGLDEKAFSFRTPSPASSLDRGFLTVDLHGGTDNAVPYDHHAIFVLNDSVIGETRWKGIGKHRATLPFPHDLLIDGTNTLVIRGELDPGVPYSFFYLNAFQVFYERAAVASGNALSLKSAGNAVITIPGFTEPDITVFDVTDPAAPAILAGVTVDGVPGNHRVSFLQKTHGKNYVAVSNSGRLNVKKAWTDYPSALKARNNVADYIIITNDLLKTAAQDIASYRAGQGYRTMVVTVEDIMDEFNFGIFDPQAIKSFLSDAATNWAVRPQYVLLAGEGTYDYKNVLGIGDNLVPTLMVDTPDGLFPSDNRFVDFNNDHVPDIAIGRLPVLTPNELSDALAKIRVYEARTAQSYARNAMILADDPVPNGNFTADSNSIASLIPATTSLTRIYLSENPADMAHDLVIHGINSGTDLVNYIGHGGLDRLADEGLLLYNDVQNLTNSKRYPIFLTLTCITGQYAYPGYDSLSEALVLKPAGGAVAVWAPTALSNHAFAATLNREFMKAAYAGAPTRTRLSYSPGSVDRRMGSLIRKALQESHALGVKPYMLDIYTLLGDPALLLR